LVDAGLSAKQLETRLIASGVDPASIDGVLLTHEHSDHTGGLKVFLNRWKVPLYCNALTARALKAVDFPGGVRLFETGSRFAIKDLQIRSFSVPHDASDPVGFRIEEDHAGFGVLTDLGFATRLVIEALRDIQGLLVETNYDDALLQNDTKRPWSVKQRILSRHGHLSNQAAAKLVAEVATAHLRHILLAHLSEDCNSAELATATAQQATDLFGFTSQINERFDMAQKLHMVELMWQVAYADGHLADHERHVLWRVADLLHVPQGAYVNARMRAQQAADAGRPGSQ
jgi:phosphoribosyl 1,2-cyclic phosphodiesterase